VSHRYQPFYCEENIWWLCQAEELAGRERWVAFITNEARCVGLMHQRAANPSELVTWDYHVIVIARAGERLEVWDLDTRLGLPVELGAYLDETFPRLPNELAPAFRVVEAEDFIARFRTDRSHMLVRGRYTQPPPPWPSPGEGGTNLMRFVDLRDDIAGEVLDLAGLRARYSR
jgi:protein N-terminal glutamine amidohydrolase